MSLERRLSASGDDSINQLDKPFSGHSMRQAAPPAKSVKHTDPGFCGCCAADPEPKEVDALMIGGGIMSATVGLMLKQLEPTWKLVMIERLHAVGEESSNGFNNAGTGHAGFMEPNYTKEVFENGKLKAVTTEKVEHVCEQFLTSRLFWSYLCKEKMIPDPDVFIHQTNHIALGIGEDQCDFIKKRYEAMKAKTLFSTMEYAGPDEREKQTKWAPLICNGRPKDQPIAMTKITHGTDVNFGALTKAKVNAFMSAGGDLRLFTTVTGLKKCADGKWLVRTKNSGTGRGVQCFKAKFVFVGAGGWALLMLQKAGIPQVKGYMALPVTGDWAVCQNPDVVAQHHVKVYAPGAPGAPPMSMPHLDFRTIDGKDMLLFGPFGSITFKFLRYGSNLDALKAMKPHNIFVTIGALSRNLGLAVMLMKDVFKNGKGKLMDIRHYYPEADAEDWTLVPAGVRAQIIKKDPKTGKGMLQFGTEVVANDEGTIVGLLGASPGASTCVTVALDTIEKCFGDKPEMGRWEPKLMKMIPTWVRGRAAGDLGAKDQRSIDALFRDTGTVLKITPPPGV
jgi:malate dehydrogenase (quinone)